MNIAINQIEIALLEEHRSVYALCSAIEIDGVTTDPQVRASFMISQGLREWASCRQSARKEYESLMRQSQDKINDIDNNQTLFWELDSDRVKEYNAKADKQVEMITAVSYIIGLSNETLKQLFATVTTLQFGK
jgi:enoyl reductase-like protein